MELIQSKSLLAKLMATENLVVEQRQVSTAYFDVKNRVLVIPVLDKNISPQLYDLFVGHEVGHALYTPLDGMEKALKENISMSLMNVLEDVRIERKIKNKYPGIRSSFVRGYKDLSDRNFFATKHIDVNDLNFIDRTNLFFKIGASQNIRFDDFEKSLLKEIESTETYDDVILVAKKVSEYVKQEIEEKKKMNPEEPEDSYEASDEEYEDEFDSDSGEIIDGDDWEKSEEEDSDLQTSYESSKYTSNEEKPDLETEEVESKTDKAFRQNEKQLFDNGKRLHYYGNIPDVDLQKLVIPHKKLWNRYRAWVSKEDDKNKLYEAVNNTKVDAFTGIDVEEFKKIRNDSKKVVAYLAKEFEMRKNADQMKRASIAKTGELNMEKIYSYKLSEDIFKKITVVPGGKSHGIVMFLDWSGSMTDHLQNTIKQLFNLMMFCKKVNLPFEVYAFTTAYGEDLHNSILSSKYVDHKKNGDVEFSDVNLMNLLSSKMSASEFHYACSALLFISKKGRYGFENPKPFWIDLSATPINEAIIAAMKIVPQFKKDYKLQIVNTVFLSDGEGHKLTDVWLETSDNIKMKGKGNDRAQCELGRYDGYEKYLVLRDPVSKHEEILDIYRTGNREVTAAYIRLLKKRTGCNVIGFYILSGRYFGAEARNFFPATADIAKLRSEFRKNKYQVVTSAGYDEYYLLRAEGLDIDEDVEFEVKENATTRNLVTAFSKYTNNRISNRVVLNRFVGLIT